MNASILGKTIAGLRKRKGLTQLQLAEKLNISNKAVSKWERGDGYPDIVLLPKLSKIFGVSIDFLLKDEEGGIAVAGNTSIEKINVVDYFPTSGVPASILSVYRAVGGCMPDILIDIAKIDSEVPLTAIGKVGDDEDGRFIISELKKHCIDTSKILTDKHLPTASSHNMIEKDSGKKVYYYNSAANSTFDIDDVYVNELDCKIFHIGYVLMLDKLNAYDSEYGTGMARLLSMISAKGIKTSVSFASKRENQFTKKIVPILKYCNYVIINEDECCRLGGALPRNSDGTLNIENIRANMTRLIDYGVRDKVIVHSNQASFLMNADKSFITLKAIDLPKGYVKSTIGAYTAYAAGCLYSLYKGYDDKKLLKFSMAAAVSALSEIDSVSGVKSKEALNAMTKRLKD